MRALLAKRLATYYRDVLLYNSRLSSANVHYIYARRIAPARANGNAVVWCKLSNKTDLRDVLTKTTAAAAAELFPRGLESFYFTRIRAAENLRPSGRRAGGGFLASVCVCVCMATGGKKNKKKVVSKADRGLSTI